MGLPVTVLRYFNVYGPRLDAIDIGRVVTILLGQALRDRPLTVIGDGRQTRCFTYVSDAILATVAAELSPQAVGGPVEVGTDGAGSMRPLAAPIIAEPG